ncbi:ABC transporter substrate-binding protein [Bacillus niameyensis]|uniref:ABC transporter substrate-binding protein n=1 Tax=Bacillus niameyensis TaxID=1522308 RepID=UPI000784AA55|nr:ABC transporter substrate-binding protein [Bacillus niameyensis]
MKKGLYIFCLVALALLSACSSSPSEAEQRKEPEVNKTDDTSSKETKEPDKTYTLENDGVDESAYKEALTPFPTEIPERIITTSVPITEMLYLLDITPVGVPTSTNPIPSEFDEIDRIGSPMQPDLEVVTSLQPDLLIGAKSLQSSLEKSLEGIELETAYLKTDSLEDLKLSFKVLGTYFNKTEEMNSVLSKILDEENELVTKAEGQELPRVMLIIGTSDSFMVMSENSYLGSIVKRAGADNIATSVLKVEDTYSPINMEDVAVADPDIIFVLASGDHGASEDMFKKEVESNDIWTKLSAYKNEQIHILEHDIFGVTSIMNVEEAMTRIADYLY